MKGLLKIKSNYLDCVIMGLALLIFFNSAPVHGFRCGTRVISVGDPKIRVLSECGEPTHIDIWEEERILRDFRHPNYLNEESEHYREPLLVKQYVTIERWTYNLGTLKFVRYLTFENGILVKIIIGERGY